MTPTPTLVPGPLYLPVLLREECPDRWSLDLALVVDTSSSMRGDAMAAARQGALKVVAPLALHSLGPISDQVAVVTFHGAANLALRLTSDRGAVEDAIRRLDVTGTGTAIDAGIQLATSELTGPRHRPSHLPVLVLLTDGRQTGGPSAALAAADAARTAGIWIITIGLGPDADTETLRAMAGADGLFFLAPTPADLERVFADLTQEISCPGRFWPNSEDPW